MSGFGKFCTYCNRKTLHQREEKGGTLCGTCGTYTGPTREELAAQAQQIVTEDAIQSFSAVKRIRKIVDDQEKRNQFAAGVSAIAMVIWAILMITILGGLYYIFTH